MPKSSPDDRVTGAGGRTLAIFPAILYLLIPIAIASAQTPAQRPDQEDELLNRWDEARAHFGSEKWETGTALINLARYYRDHKQYAAAVTPYELALEIAEKVRGANAPADAIYVRELASVYRALNRTSEAEALEKRSAMNLAGSQSANSNAAFTGDDAPHIPDGEVRAGSAAQPATKRADDADEAQKAYLAKDYARVRELADGGNAVAQRYLGFVYLLGQGVPRDRTQAAAWLRKAADQGNREGQEKLAEMYQTGGGVPKDEAQAAAWYRKAADQGLAGAQINLGAMYLHGEGVPKDDVEAVALFRKAADQGSAVAQEWMGSMYEGGRGVPKDDAEAVVWYRKAADGGWRGAQFDLGVRYENGQGVPKNSEIAIDWYRKAAAQGMQQAKDALVRLTVYSDLSPSPKPGAASNTLSTSGPETGASLKLALDALNRKDYTQAKVGFETLARENSPEAQYNLGVMYQMGYGVVSSDSEAVKWYRLAADHGYAAGQSRLGAMYRQGRGVVRDYTEAAKWYRLAADQGYAAAQNDLGVLYRDGEGVAPDDSEAAKWFWMAAVQGAPLPQTNLGRMYENGRGVIKNYEEAARLYRLAAERNYAPAQLLIGLMYEDGRGVAKNTAEAVKWYRLAGAQGNEDAKKALARLSPANE